MNIYFYKTVQNKRETTYKTLQIKRVCMHCKREVKGRKKACEL